REHLRGIFILPASPVEARSLDRSAPEVAAHEPPSVTWTRLGENSVMLRAMAAGVSPINCYEPLLVKRIAPPGPAVIRGEGALALSEPTFSPNRVTAHAIVGSDP